VCSEMSRFSAAFSYFRRLLAYLALAFSAIPWAQAQYGYEIWTVDNGMPENEIRGITQTPDGYLWIATFNGLARLDGVHLTIFNRETPGLLSNQFGSMQQGRGGDLWLHSVDRGLVRYHDGRFRAYGRQDGIPADIVNGVTGSDDGDVWVLSGGRVARWEEATAHFVDVAPDAPRLAYKTLLWDSRGFWARRGDSIHCFSEGRFIDYKLPPRVAHEGLWGVALDESGTLWVETIGGYRAHLRADNQGPVAGPPASADVTVGATRHERLPMRVGPHLIRTFEFVSSNRKVSIIPRHFYEDKQRNLWIGTLENGLYRLQRQSIRTYSMAEGLVDRDTYAIYQDRSNAMWVGAWHQGLSRFANGEFTSYTMADGLPSELVTALFEDKEGRFWVGTHGGLSLFDHGRFHLAKEPELPEDAVVQAICEDRHGTLWFATRAGLARYENGKTRFLTRKDGLAADDTHVILETSNGDLWLGGYGGLTRIHNGEFERWTNLPSNNIWSIHEDAEGVLWIGTYDGGLLRYRNGAFTSFTTKDGLFDNGVFQTLEDAYGYLWISCSRGIYRVSKRDLNDFAEGRLAKVASTPYGKIDGMQSRECNGGLWPAGIHARDGLLWFPTRDGVAVVDPEAAPHDPMPPSLTIESSLVDNVAKTVEAPLKIPPGAHNVEIHYTAPSFLNAEQTQFKYRLEGLDTDWIEVGDRRTAYYSHLLPGDYVFHVIAGNSDGVWNLTGKTLEVTVSSPFYRTWWFETLVMLALAGLLTAIWLYRDAQLRRAQAMQQAFSRQLIASQEAERKRIAAEMHDSLGQRLVVIKSLAALLLRSKKSASPDDADLMTEITQEASLAIDETRAISYNLRPFQLDRLGLKKAIEGMVRTVSAASGIRMTTELDDIDAFFPEDLRINFYRIVQESLGNIMKHSQAGTVTVRAQKKGSGMTLTIEDNGVGFSSSDRSSSTPGGGFGLTGMGERAKLLGGELSMKSITGRGTTVVVEFRRSS
jgi:signal transduction histidine kinase